MADAGAEPVATPDDPRLFAMGEEAVAGTDQIPALLNATPDERLDNLVALVEFVYEARDALRETR